MFIIKDNKNEIIAISDAYKIQEENGNVLINDFTIGIAGCIVDTIEESETIPEGWEKVGKVYQPIIVHPTEDELRQEGFDECIAMLMEEGVI